MLNCSALKSEKSLQSGELRERRWKLKICWKGTAWNKTNWLKLFWLLELIELIGDSYIIVTSSYKLITIFSMKFAWPTDARCFSFKWMISGNVSLHWVCNWLMQSEKRSAHLEIYCYVGNELMEICIFFFYSMNLKIFSKPRLHF